MSTTTEALTSRDGLLRAIIENPHDRWPREVFADWLEENADPERARKFRALLGVRVHPPTPMVWHEVRRRFVVKHGDDVRAILFDSPGKQPLTWEPAKVGKLLLDGDALVEQGGFVEGVRCLASRWLRCCRKLVRILPITGVMLHDVGLFGLSDGGVSLWDNANWIGGGQDLGGDIPTVLFDELAEGEPNQNSVRRYRKYATREDAFADVSDACVRYARKLANLPELHPDSSAPDNSPHS